MLILRCTRKLLDRLPAPSAADDAASTTLLGDWYATILMVRPAHLVLLVNEMTRLPVVLPARELATLVDRIPHAIAETLTDLGVAGAAIERERAAMQSIVCAPTRSRSVVGAINEFVFQIQIRREDEPWADLRALSFDLTRVLIGVGGREYVRPADEARRLLATYAVPR
jgi:hypothetical protein